MGPEGQKIVEPPATCQTSKSSVDPPPRLMQLQRSKWKAFSEGLIEWTIRVSGISAVVFVFAIFIFVFWEGKGLLFSDDFSISELLTSEKWDPTHNRRATVLPDYSGHFSVALWR